MDVNVQYWDESDRDTIVRIIDFYHGPFIDVYHSWYLVFYLRLENRFSFLGRGHSSVTEYMDCMQKVTGCMLRS